VCVCLLQAHFMYKMTRFPSKLTKTHPPCRHRSQHTRPHTTTPTHDNLPRIQDGDKMAHTLAASRYGRGQHLLHTSPARVRVLIKPTSSRRGHSVRTQSELSPNSVGIGRVGVRLGAEGHAPRPQRLLDRGVAARVVVEEAVRARKLLGVRARVRARVMGGSAAGSGTGPEAGARARAEAGVRAGAGFRAGAGVRDRVTMRVRRGG